MPRNTRYQRIPWEDRFNRPAPRDLRTGLVSRARPLFDRVRRSLLELDGVEECAAWYGDGWKWTVEFRTKGSDEPLAVLVPAPEDLQLAVPLERDFIASLSIKRMKRAVRDGLDLAQEPFDTRWAVWSLASAGLVDDLQQLVESKLRHQSSKAAG